MIETLFGSSSPMWAGTPAAGFAFQTPFAVGSRPVVTPMFGPPTIPGAAGGVSTGAQGVSVPSAWPANAYNYYTPSFVGALPFAANPLVAFAGPEAMAGVTAPSLLAAVAVRRGQPQGPANDQEAEDFISDALDLLPGAADVEVRCEGGRVLLTGSVQQKRVKRDVGEVAWAIPGLNDVQNNVTITPRRRTRGSNRDAEAPASASGRKQG